MKPDPPKPDTSVALVLGASEWPYHARLGKSEAFRASADDLLGYLRDGLGLPTGQIKSLFDADLSDDDQLAEIQRFVTHQVEEARARAKPIRDLLIFYVGHGGFSSEDYYLAIR